MNVIVLCLVIFIMALFSPMLYCGLSPHWPQNLWVLFLLILSALSLLCFSLITYFLCGRSHFMLVLAQVVFCLRTESAATGGREPDSPLDFTPAVSVHPWSTSYHLFFILLFILFCYLFFIFCLLLPAFCLYLCCSWPIVWLISYSSDSNF